MIYGKSTIHRLRINALSTYRGNRILVLLQLWIPAGYTEYSAYSLRIKPHRETNAVRFLACISSPNSKS